MSKSKGSDQLDSVGLHNEFTETYSYDGLNRLDYRSISTVAGQSLPSGFTQTQNYDYDDWGNVKYKDGAGHYKYDSTAVHKLLGVYTDAAYTAGNNQRGQINLI